MDCLKIDREDRRVNESAVGDGSRWGRWRRANRNERGNFRQREFRSGGGVVFAG